MHLQLVPAVSPAGGGRTGVWKLPSPPATTAMTSDPAGHLGNPIAAWLHVAYLVMYVCRSSRRCCGDMFHILLTSIASCCVYAMLIVATDAVRHHVYGAGGACVFRIPALPVQNI